MELTREMIRQNICVVGFADHDYLQSSRDGQEKKRAPLKIIFFFSIEQCGYDFNDCCQMENDRSLCSNCTCLIPENKFQTIKSEFASQYCKENYMYFLGNGNCDLSHNTEEYYFDLGDCCLDPENLECRLSFMNQTSFKRVDCPTENPCIPSNIYCVPEELGDGKCQDYNNGPFCDFDLGDCCLHLSGGINMYQDCCQCECKSINPSMVHPSLINYG